MDNFNLQTNTELASPKPESNPFKVEVPTEVNQPKQLGITGLIGIVLVLLVAGLGSYKLYEQSTLTKKIATAEQLLEQQKNQLQSEDNKKVDETYKKSFWDSKRESQLYWTNIFNRLKESFPNNDVISIDSISGTESGTISITAKTTAASTNPYLDTAILVESLKAKSFLTNVFIPSITSSINEQGQEFLSYNITVDYKKDKSDKKLVETNSPKTNETETSNTTKVTEPTSSNLNQRIEELRAQTKKETK